MHEWDAGENRAQEAEDGMMVLGLFGLMILVLIGGVAGLVYFA